MACGRLEGLPGGKKKNMAAQFIFAKLHLNRLQDFWNNVLLGNETKGNDFFLTSSTTYISH